VKVAFVTPSVSRAIGGIFEIERRLGQSLSECRDTEVAVYSLKDGYTAEDLRMWRPLVPQTFPASGPVAFGYSPALARSLLSTDNDVAHLHALWMYTSIVTGTWAKRTKRPYIVTPNGMLDPWALWNSAWKKQIAAALYERRTLHGAACLQANTPKEAADFRALGLKNPICIIPNGVDLPQPPDAENPEAKTLKSETQQPPWSGLVEPGQKVLLYLGRIHPKKGLINLLKAWARVQRSDVGGQRSEWLLAIVGWDQAGHEAQLKQLCTELRTPFADVWESQSQIANRKSQIGPPSVLFLGPQFGDAKASCYRHCDAFILPSFSEGLPMVILEAWSYAKPVLMTPECNLPEGFAANAAIRIEPNAEDIQRGLHDLLHAPCSTLHALGVNGRNLVAEKFTWPSVAQQMKSVYDWVLGGEEAPSCVVHAK
jgi:glycosyltransferase involved in cell wall biosynthesis